MNISAWLVLLLPVAVLGFTVHPNNGIAQKLSHGRRPLFPHNKAFVRDSLTTQLRESAVEVKFPNQEEAVALGAREWPQQVKRGIWSERVANGVPAARYVLDGTGSIAVTLLGDDGMTPKTNIPTTHMLVPGSLIEAMGPATIDWNVDEEMIVLTPGYEQGNLLAVVAATLVVLTALLVSGVGQ
eukprot:scaffold145776_cov40-Attheya_sp.AAC.1